MPTTSKSEFTFLIMAGGTGGHVMPGLAVADKLRNLGYSVHWLGTQLGIEARLVPEKRIPIDYIEIQGLRGKGLMRWLKAPFQLAKAFSQAYFALKRIKPCAVISLGGYVAGPGGLAAWVLGIPLIIHEQNAIAGLTNRLLSPFAKRILMGFPKTFSQKGITTGNPVRAGIFEVSRLRQPLESDALRILVLGGSLGAKFLNERVPEAINLLGSPKVEIWHQTGGKEEEATLERYKIFRRVRVVAFIENMADAYKWADLVICRAGALTVAELAAAGLPSILVPFPYAVDDHQSYNARYLADPHAAIIEPQATLSASKLANLIDEFQSNRSRLLQMSHQCRALARPEATNQVVQNCIEVGCESSRV